MRASAIPASGLDLCLSPRARGPIGTIFAVAPATDPPGPTTANAGSKEYRVIRGAYYGAATAFTFTRRWFDPTDAHTRIGVRCASSAHPDTLDDPLAK